MISHTCAVIVLSHNFLATYEVAWNKASYWYELVDAFRVGSQSEVGCSEK